MSERLPIGTIIYLSGWNEDGEPCAWQHTITGHKELGGALIYLYKGGGFTQTSIGRSVFVTEYDALENLKGMNPTLAITSKCIRRKRG